MADGEACNSDCWSMVNEEGEVVRNFFSHHELDEILIEEVKTFRCIWDMKCRGFKDSGGVVRAAWKAISQKLGKDGMSISVLNEMAWGTLLYTNCITPNTFQVYVFLLLSVVLVQNCLEIVHAVWLIP